MVSILFKWLVLLPALYVQEVSDAGNSFTHKGKAPLALHPIYMSVTEIEHNTKDRTLEISCKIFTDDFEKTLRKIYSGYVDLIHPKDKTAMNKLVSEYVQKHLHLKVDGRPVGMEFIGYEQQEEGITSYYQVNNVPSVKRIEITDNLLYEYKDQQISLLHVIVNGNRKSTRLVNPEEKAEFEW